MSVRFGRFELLALLGKGGMAEVFRGRIAEGPEAGSAVAIKRLLPELVTKPGYLNLFAVEAAVMRQLRHPGVVRFVEAGEIGGQHYIAMEYVEGPDLARLLYRLSLNGSALPLFLCCHIAQAVAEALDAAQKMPGPSGAPLAVVHCDVNPANVFVEHTGRVALGDFGVSRASGLADLTMEAGFAGKAGYMPRELFAGAEPSAATDVFALGALLYKMVTGKTPFGSMSSGDDLAQIAARLQAAKILSPRQLRPEVPAWLDRLIMRALSPRLGGAAAWSQWWWRPFQAWRTPVRFSDAGAFLAALRAAPAPLGTADAPAALAALVREQFGARGATRRDERFFVMMPVRVQAANRRLSGVTRNISRTGVFLELADPPQLGERIELTLAPPEGDLTLQGDVVWNRTEASGSGGEPQGCGVRFVLTQQDVERRVLHFIDRLYIHRARDVAAVLDGEDVVLHDLIEMAAPT